MPGAPLRTSVLFAVAVLFVAGASTTAEEDTPPDQLTIDFSETVGWGSPYVFGGTQPRYLSDRQWDTLAAQGFRFMRTQADLAELVPCESPEAFRANENGCANPENWNWTDGIYGGNFVVRAAERDMRPCLVIKNATWNRYEGAPVDEETMPRDLEVWGEIVRKIVDHYEGQVAYIELFNEVDRDPQFLVEGSPYTRKEGYQAVARRALEAVDASQYPLTPVGGPVAAGVGEEQVRWLLADPEIRGQLGFLSFHTFDAYEYPHHTVRSYRSLMEEYGADLPIVRSSFVPEEGEDRLPGTADPVSIAPHVFGAYNDGLEAQGLWEIQPRDGEDDPRYWFIEGTRSVDTAHLYRMISRTLGLGEGPSRRVAVRGLERTEGLAALNQATTPVIALRGGSADGSVRLDLKNLPIAADRVQVEVFRGDRVGDGRTVRRTITRPVSDGAIGFELELPAESIVGMRIVPA